MTKFKNSENLKNTRTCQLSDVAIQSDKRTGFTLAEVLITLGIIGVVAAITMPALIKNYQKHAWVNQLKTTISLLENGFKNMLAAEGVQYLQDTSVYQSIGGSDYSYSTPARGAITHKRCYYSGIHTSDSVNCKDFFANLGKYFKIVKIEDVPNQWLDDKSNWAWYLNKSGSSTHNNAVGFYGPFLHLSNGSLIFYGRHRSVPVNYLEHGVLSDFAVDINGSKGPNIYGRDIFWLNVFDDGRIVPSGTKLRALDTGGDETTWHWSGTTANANCYTAKEGITSQGYGCAGRIMENGWKMDY